MMKIVLVFLVAEYSLALFWLCYRFSKQISAPSFLSIDMGEEEARKIRSFLDIDRQHERKRHEEERCGQA